MKTEYLDTVVFLQRPLSDITKMEMTDKALRKLLKMGL
jgi:hypothetical protein